MDHEQIRAQVARYHQEHLFTFWDELGDAQRRELLEDIARIDFSLVAELIATHVRARPETHVGRRIEPAGALPEHPGPGLERSYRDAHTWGRKLLAEGKVAALVVAGGQGTRLGFDRPKGEFPISPVKSKSLFQLFAEAISATGRRYGHPVPWYVMTSPATDARTRAYFAEHGHFGLNPEDVIFFCQGVMPALDPTGRVLLDRKHRVALSPDGHGGSLRALAGSGALADMRRRGIEVVSYFQVDNPLVAPADPLFLGLHTQAGAEMSAIAVPKANDLERVGNFARVDGRLCVIEYSDLPEELAHAHNPDGSRTFDDGSIAVHAFSRAFLEQLTTEAHGFALPWHRADKEVPFVDLASGERINPERPNAIKLELFVFDALPLAQEAIVLRRERAEWFSPVKNAEGVDSPATTRRDLSRRAVRWLEACGVAVPRTVDAEPDEPDGTFEISPLVALDVDQLRAVLAEPPVIQRGASFYLG